MVQHKEHKQKVHRTPQSAKTEKVQDRESKQYKILGQGSLTKAVSVLVYMNTLLKQRLYSSTSVQRA